MLDLHRFFSSKGFGGYLDEAKAILENNWTGAYTRPSDSLYPHQWNWDSAFIAMGYAHYNRDRACRELTHLFDHQWPNGMTPHIVFNPDALGHYFPEPDFWQVPDDRMTSGITMPPIHAAACIRIHQVSSGGAKDFLKTIFPKILAGHRYFYRYRDPDRTGLVYIRHPWESGLDNSPAWDGPLKRMNIDKSKLPDYTRKDLDHDVSESERPDNDDYDRYVFLVDLFRRLDYDEENIRKECPFLVQDVLLNSILCRANHDLLEIADIIGEDGGEIKEWTETTEKAIRDRLWSEERGQFDPWDLVAGEHLTTATAAMFMPMFALAATDEQAETLYKRLNSHSFCALHQGNCFTIPNYDMEREDFDSKKYWRGPVWMNINWMVSQGIKDYGYRAKSEEMKKDMIQLPIRFGFHEYFDSVTGEGYGSDRFSWTAALFIDLIKEYYEREPGLLKRLFNLGARRLEDTLVLNDTGAASSGEGERPAPEHIAGRLMSAINTLRDKHFDMLKGKVNYPSLKDSPEYETYRDMTLALKDYDLNRLSTREEKLAYWINLYNAIVVQGIVELGIEESVQDVAGFFKRIAYRIGGFLFSPDDMEHGILRANARPPYGLFRQFGPMDKRKAFAVERLDPRIHFALVCGSRSCAPIRFYEAHKIDEQLDTAAASFVNSTEVVILPEKNRVLLSHIFKWYKRDFGRRDYFFDFLLRYLDENDESDYLRKHRDDIDIEYLVYDWNLNH